MTQQPTIVASELKPDRGLFTACCCEPVAQIYNHQGIDGDCAISCCLTSCGLLPGVIHYMCIYQPQSDFSSLGNVKPEPDCVAKCCCPVPTVYYHEQNEMNSKCCFACCCGCFYTVLCYHPTWSEKWTGQSAHKHNRNGNKGSVVMEAQTPIPKAEPGMQRDDVSTLPVATVLTTV